MAAELRTFLVESVREKLADRRFGVRERDQAVPYIARRRDIELLADAAGAATIVGYRHDRRDPGFNVAQTAEESRESGAAADGHDVHGWADRAEAVRGDNRADPLVLLAGCHERIEDRTCQTPDSEVEDRNPDEQDDQFTIGVGNELKRKGTDRAAVSIGKVVFPVDPGETHCQRQPNHTNADDQERNPTLNQHARPKPNSPAVQCTFPLRGRRSRGANAHRIIAPGCSGHRSNIIVQVPILC